MPLSFNSYESFTTNYYSCKKIIFKILIHLRMRLCLIKNKCGPKPITAIDIGMGRLFFDSWQLAFFMNIALELQTLLWNYKHCSGITNIAVSAGLYKHCCTVVELQTLLHCCGIINIAMLLYLCGFTNIAALLWNYKHCYHSYVFFASSLQYDNNDRLEKKEACKR